MKESQQPVKIIGERMCYYFHTASCEVYLKNGKHIDGMEYLYSDNIQFNDIAYITVWEQHLEPEDEVKRIVAP